MSTDLQAPITTPEPRPTAKPTKTKSKGWVWWLLVVLGLGAAAYYYYTHNKKPAQQQPTKGAATPGRGAGGRGGGVTPVSVAKAQKGDLGVYIEGIGAVTPVYTVSVTSRVTGQLMTVNYREGQIVKKGDLLAVIDPRPYEAALIQAQGQLQRDQASLRNANIDLERYRAALEQHAIPEQTYATQLALVAQDEGIVKLDQGNLDAAQVNLDYTKITSPIDGRVGLRSVDPGNIVIANGTTPMLTITQLQPITIIFTIAQDFLSDFAPQLREGHSLRVDAMDRSKQTLLGRGTVLTVDNQIDLTTGTVRVRATFPNKDNALFPNQFVNARMLVNTLQGVTLIPTAAIQRDNDRTYVYLLQPNNTVQLRNITVNRTEGGTAAITEVNPGDTLITDGFDRLTDGAHVSVRQPGGGVQPGAGQRKVPGFHGGQASGHPTDKRTQQTKSTQ